ncbi:MAG: helix-turn-helix transcriptional regulator [Chloroflexi bacterium]|jgi:transcriptional regulator with XRE-family HTH domain|nr:helix-turn-helix transcriptional regulator [Chloroflexota bacterium]
MKQKNKPQWKESGDFIKSERERADLTRLALAKHVGRELSTIISWELGYRRPKQKQLLLLAQLFGIRVQILQAKAQYTPEFNWYASFSAKPDSVDDTLLTASEEEKIKLRDYLHYLRFKEEVMESVGSILD